MRYLVGFVVVVTVLLAAPASVSAQDGGDAKLPDRTKLAWIPEHLKQRMPQYRYDPDRPSAQPGEVKRDEPANQNGKTGESKGVAAPSEPSTAADTPPPVRGAQRWHPDAFVAPEGAEATEFKIEYTQPLTPEERQMHKRKRNIAVGVTVSVIAIAIGVGVGMAVTAPLRNMEW